MHLEARFLAAAWVALGLMACGGSVGDENGGNREGVGTCPDCPDGTPKQEPMPGPEDVDAGAGAPGNPNPDPVPAPMPTPAPEAAQGIALRYADFPPPSSGSSGGSGGSGGVEIDPNTLYVMIGNASPL